MIVCAPQDVVFTEEALFVRRDDGRETKIDVLYRNFELFDLLNIPKQELMLYAARHNRVKITPPPKAHFEEKSSFALFHHPDLRAYWRAELGEAVDAAAARDLPAHVDRRSAPDCRGKPRSSTRPRTARRCTIGRSSKSSARASATT